MQFVNDFASTGLECASRSRGASPAWRALVWRASAASEVASFLKFFAISSQPKAAPDALAIRIAGHLDFIQEVIAILRAAFCIGLGVSLDPFRVRGVVVQIEVIKVFLCLAPESSSYPRRLYGHQRVLSDGLPRLP